MLAGITRSALLCRPLCVAVLEIDDVAAAIRALAPLIAIGCSDHFGEE
jgi:hypothetical protein